MSLAKLFSIVVPAYNSLTDLYEAIEFPSLKNVTPEVELTLSKIHKNPARSKTLGYWYIQQWRGKGHIITMLKKRIKGFSLRASASHIKFLDFINEDLVEKFSIQFPDLHLDSKLTNNLSSLSAFAVKHAEALKMKEAQEAKAAEVTKKVKKVTKKASKKVRAPKAGSKKGKAPKMTIQTAPKVEFVTGINLTESPIV